MDFQEQLFKDQIRIIHEARDEKEENFEKLQQQEREKVKQSIANPKNTEDYKRRYIIKRFGIWNKIAFFCFLQLVNIF